MLTSSHWAVGLAFAGSVMILTGMVQGFYSVRAELTDGQRRRELRQTVMEVWRKDPRSTMDFSGTVEEKRRATELYNAAWADYRRIGDAGGAKLATFGDVSRDPLGEESQLAQLRQQIKALKNDLIWIGTGTILTAAAGLVTMM
ncbi:hypothetical protein J2W14_000524 [Pseudarthrobacter oxydans]|uniref:hypothetical protein n=1 Tax=Pseudarthrobacter oxydans TaxID=1671 RepID=UPI002787E087|nr:hypothetical protein [Pseudarthrobacter oxydans]MDP9981148.1 hypothetical protein [Pseudarthrobacter oxydans]